MKLPTCDGRLIMWQHANGPADGEGAVSQRAAAGRQWAAVEPRCHSVLRRHGRRRRGFGRGVDARRVADTPRHHDTRHDAAARRHGPAQVKWLPSPQIHTADLATTAAGASASWPRMVSLDPDALPRESSAASLSRNPARAARLPLALSCAVDRVHTEDARYMCTH
ncbi:hypothetical protein BDU57DRAFT_303875 [Ampelomyces quisqualis]|uniref:Uncharacterized protein n=1 Tax=Ampelomyces quisqualis TaxID=50730 RepID=A0A6A5QIU1_AMPQU|nr:hypothetical protein BDU57DRAFT_303875 [Ampelomyces quisqualis]